MGIIRKTQSLELLLNEFSSQESALSTVHLIKKFENKFNKTTIYRVLDKLEDDGVLHSFLGFNGVKWYAKCKSCTKSHHNDVHPHFHCLSCGKTDCLDINISIPEIPNRQVISSQFLFQGKCESCM